MTSPKPDRPKVTTKGALDRATKATLAKREADIKKLPQPKGSPERVRAVDSVLLRYSGKSAKDTKQILDKMGPVVMPKKKK